MGLHPKSGHKKTALRGGSALYQELLSSMTEDNRTRRSVKTLPPSPLKKGYSDSQSMESLRLFHTAFPP